MQVDIFTRHFTLADAQKERLTERLEKLERFSPRPPMSARLNLTREGGEFEVDLVFRLRSADFRASSRGPDPENAAEEAVESIRSQLQKFKGRVSNRAKAEEGGLGRAMLVGGPVAEEAPPVAEGFRLEDRNLAEAMDELRRSTRPFHVFRNRETGRLAVVYRLEDGGVGLMSPVEE